MNQPPLLTFNYDRDTLTMIVLVDTYVRVHKEESWTHRIKRFRSQRPRSSAERFRSGVRLWKRRCCRASRYREWRDDMM